MSNEKVEKVSVSKEEIEELKKLREMKQEMDKKKEKQKLTWKRHWAKQKLLCQKAEAAGLKVTEAEIDEEIKKTK